MNRRKFLYAGSGFCALGWNAGALQTSEGRQHPPSTEQEAPRPIPEPHFPSKLHQFTWRNWELANVDRLTKVVQTTPQAILELGSSMGLPRKRHLTEDQLARLYITVIRQNWHLLPERQIIELRFACGERI